MWRQIPSNNDVFPRDLQLGWWTSRILEIPKCELENCGTPWGVCVVYGYCMFVTTGVDPSGLRMHRVNSKAINSLTATNIQKRNNCFKQENINRWGSYQFFQLDRHWKDLMVAHQDITTLHPMRPLVPMWRLLARRRLAAWRDRRRGSWNFKGCELLFWIWGYYNFQQIFVKVIFGCPLRVNWQYLWWFLWNART